MKSSTFHKTGLTREKMLALEKIISEKKAGYDNSPNVYVRSFKDKDLDLLWSSKFSLNKKLTRNQILVGFLAGILFTVIATSFVNNLQNNISDIDFWQKDNAVRVSPADNSVPIVQTEIYTIKPGDTIDSIVMKFYGVYDIERIAQIQAINNLEDPSKIYVGQKLTIPIN